MSKLEINQLDLFSGIGGFHLGFERAGYKVNSYFSEIDKHAVAVYKQQFKDSTYVGSVTDVRGADLPTIDLITFGSPCQDFSLAGKRKGMEGERSSLILEAIRLINECRPRAFVWENVKGTFSSNDGEDFAAILQAFTNIGDYRLEWQLLNTSWFLPQNRERIYLVGYSTTPGGDWGGVFPIGAATKHIDEKVGNNTRKSSGRNPAHSRTLRKDIGSCGSGDTYIKAYRKGDGKEISNKIAPTLTGGGNSGGNHSDMAVLKVKSATSKEAVVEPMIAAQRGRYQEDGTIKQELEINKEGKSNTLTAVQKDNMVVEPKIIGYTRDAKGKVTDRHLKDEAGTIHSSSGGGGNTDQFVNQPTTCRGGLQKNAAHFEEKSPALTSAMGMGGGHTPIVDQLNYRIRRLTPIECERLQGFPDNHTEYGNYDGEVKKMSNTQRYKQCGNAVTVDVVQAVAEQLKPIYYA